jgi:hypothetical protein
MEAGLKILCSSLTLVMSPGPQAEWHLGLIYGLGDIVVPASALPATV